MTHEFVGESHPEREPTIADVITGAQWDGWPLRIMTRDALYAQGRDGGIVNYVWPHEGQFGPRGGWKFHKGKVMDGTTEIDCPRAPLMVDQPSARGFMLIWDAINEKNRAKTEDLLKSRGLTVWMFDKIIWPNIGFGS